MLRGVRGGAGLCRQHPAAIVRLVRSPAGHSLSLESSTASLALLAPAGVDISSISGHVHVQVQSDIQFQS